MLKKLTLVAAALTLSGCASDELAFSDQAYHANFDGVTISGTVQGDTPAGAGRQRVRATNTRNAAVCAGLEGRRLMLVPAGQTRVIAELGANDRWKPALAQVNAAGACA